jgi:TetR/AcrR family transcriptional regulator, lmrAB and yxaGH operons repressor
MPRTARAAGEGSPRAKLVAATLDLLRRAGLSGAGINHVIDASQAPKGSVYHYFPGGKQQLVTEALRAAERTVGESFAAVFGDTAPIAAKVRALFTKTAVALEANEFAKGCPVAAVTLDLGPQSDALRTVCGDVFDGWVDVMAGRLSDVPPDARRSVAQLILATLEGALVLARARGAKTPLLETGEALAAVLDARFSRRRRTERR